MGNGACAARCSTLKNGRQPSGRGPACGLLHARAVARHAFNTLAEAQGHPGAGALQESRSRAFSSLFPVGLPIAPQLLVTALKDHCEW